MKNKQIEKILKVFSKVIIVLLIAFGIMGMIWGDTVHVKPDNANSSKILNTFWYRSMPVSVIVIRKIVEFIGYILSIINFILFIINIKNKDGKGKNYLLYSIALLCCSFISGLLYFF